MKIFSNKNFLLIKRPDFILFILKKIVNYAKIYVLNTPLENFNKLNKYV